MGGAFYFALTNITEKKANSIIAMILSFIYILGYPLNSITIVSQNGDKRVMLSELSPEQQDEYFSKYTSKVAEFIYEGIEADLDEPYIE